MLGVEPETMRIEASRAFAAVGRVIGPESEAILAVEPAPALPAFPYQ